MLCKHRGSERERGREWEREREKRGREGERERVGWEVMKREREGVISAFSVF